MKRNTNEKKQYKAIIFALLAAALYAISTPISKLLLEEIPPKLMAAFLYLGAGFGMFVIGMVVLDIAAPILFMVGLTLTTSSNASLLNNFEIVATSVIALFFFNETISKRLWLVSYYI